MMANRDEMIAFLRAREQTPSREEMIAFLQRGGSEKSSPVVSGVRQFVQAGTGGFSDEFAGGVSAVGRVLGVEGLGGPIRDIRLAEGGPTLDRDAIAAEYRRTRDLERGALARDFDENPVATSVGMIAGAVSSPLNRLAKGASAANAGARLGAIGGLGMSESEDLGGMALDAATGLVIGGTVGKGLEKGQELLARGASKLAQASSPARQKANAAELRAAAERLGIKVTPGMLDDTGFVERLESTLAQSPSIFGQSVARNRRAVTDRLEGAVADLTQEATTLSPYQVGEKFKAGVTAKVGERLDPISTVFNEVAESTRFIPIGDRSKAAIIRNIENMDTYKLTGGAGKPRQYVEMIARAENADQVKTMMTLLNQDIAASTGAEKSVLIGIKNKLSNLENNSIMRSAIAAAKEGGMRESTGKNIGLQVVNDLKDARREYRSLLEDLKGLTKEARIRPSGGPTATLDAIEAVPSERVGDRFFNLDNNRQVQALRDKFPEEFNLLRAGRLRELVDGSVDFTQAGQGRTSPAKFLKEVRSLSPEAKQILFPQGAGTIDDMQAIQNSLPRNFNPSGTASSQDWQTAVLSNVRDIPQYLLYRGASSNLARDVTERMVRAPDMNLAYRQAPQLFTESANRAVLPAPVRAPMTASGERETERTAGVPAKGPDKWANDGLKNLLEHAGDGKAKETLNKAKGALLQSKKGKDLLIQASAAKPNSKAMAKILERISEEYGASSP